MGSVHWKDRGETDMVPNWPGVLADLEHGTTPKRHRFDARPVLRDTGRLKGSIAFRLIADHTVEVGTRLPYAGVLHAGGESKSVRITAAIQERLWKWIQKARARMKSAPKRLEKARQSGDEEKAARAVKTTDRDIVQGSMAEKLTWLLNKKFTDDQLTIKHPARPIVGLPDDLVRDIEQRYGHKIGQV